MCSALSALASACRADVDLVRESCLKESRYAELRRGNAAEKVMDLERACFSASTATADLGSRVTVIDDTLQSITDSQRFTSAVCSDLGPVHVLREVLRF